MSMHVTLRILRGAVHKVYARSIHLRTNLSPFLVHYSKHFDLLVHTESNIAIPCSTVFDSCQGVQRRPTLTWGG